jgi:uncharacterized protein YecE (DUF72 family)
MLAALAAPLAHAQIYKWVDAQGVTHYTSEPPPNTAKAVALPLQNATATPAPANGAANPSWQDQDSAFRARYDKKKAEQALKDQQDVQNAAARRQACYVSRNNVLTAERASNLYTLGAQGERVYMSDAEREQALAGARAAVLKNCDD